MSNDEVNYIALLDKLDASSFSNDVEKFRAAEAARALLARLETPKDTIFRVVWGEVSLKLCTTHYEAIF